MHTKRLPCQERWPRCARGIPVLMIPAGPLTWMDFRCLASKSESMAKHCRVMDAGEIRRFISAVILADSKSKTLDATWIRMTSVTFFVDNISSILVSTFFPLVIHYCCSHAAKNLEESICVLGGVPSIDPVLQIRAWA